MLTQTEASFQLFGCLGKKSAKEVQSFSDGWGKGKITCPEGTRGGLWVTLPPHYPFSPSLLTKTCLLPGAVMSKKRGHCLAFVMASCGHGTVLEVPSVISRKTLPSVPTQLRLPILSCPLFFFMLLGISHTTEGQVAILHHEVALKMVPCCGTDKNL